MKKFFYLLLVLNWSVTRAQLTQIPTGVSGDLVELSVIGNSIIINDTYGYSMKSTDECKNLTYVSLPGPLGHIKKLQRLDANNWCLLTYDASQMLFHQSSDAGANWIQKMDTTGQTSAYSAFFNFSEGVVTRTSHYMKTDDNCGTWVPGTISIGGPNPASMCYVKTYGDSMICMGTGNFFAGSFYISKDRGNTWPISWSFSNSQVNFGNMPSGFFFLNKDSIFGISRNGESTKTINAGNSWVNSPIPLEKSHGVNFRNAKEGYVVGSDAQGKGVVIKTTDFGKTWWTYNTGVNTTLLNIEFLNDSTALMSGTNGVLLKWQYKKTVFVNLREQEPEDIKLNVFPNPFKDKLKVDFEVAQTNKITGSISNSLGQLVYPVIELSQNQEINLGFLPGGVYFLRLQYDLGQKTVKIIKE